MKEKDFVEGTIINGVPFMPVLIRNPNNGKSAIIELLVDSGAQHTIIQKNILYDKLGYTQNDVTEEVKIQGIIPKEECIVYCPEFRVNIFVNRQWLSEIKVVAFNITSDQGVMGRNILQLFNIELKFLNNLITFKKG